MRIRLFSKSKSDSKKEVKVEIPATIKPKLAPILKRLRDNDLALTTLNLTGYQLSYEDIKILASILENNTTLLSLALCNNNLDSRSAQALLPVIERNKSLLALNLSKNKLGAKGVETIINALKMNNTLLGMNISENELGLDKLAGVVKVLATMLKQNNSLIFFDLGWFDEGVNSSSKILGAFDSLDKALVGNTTLSILNFRTKNTLKAKEKIKQNHAVYKQFFNALKLGNKEEVNRLLKAGAGVFANMITVLDKATITPLILAVQSGSPECVKLLLPYCRNFYFSVEDSVPTALHLADDLAKKAGGELSVYSTISKLLKMYQQIITSHPQSIGNIEFITKALTQSEKSVAEAKAVALIELPRQESKDESESQVPLEIRGLLQKAQEGDRNAQFDLGYRYEAGLGVTQNMLEANKWYRRSAWLGNCVAQCRWGMHGDMWIRKRAEKLWLQAMPELENLAQSGDNHAQAALGRLYYRGLGGKTRDFTIAIEWCQKAVSKDNIDALYTLGDIFGNMFAVSRSQEDNIKSFQWYLKAASQGHIEAQYRLGWDYQDGIGCKQDEKQAIVWYQKASDHGHKLAHQALEFLMSFKLAQQGDAEAQYRVAEYYGKNSNGIPWYQKAADQGHKAAMTKLLPTRCTKETEKEVIQRAKQGIADAEYLLGEYYEKEYLVRNHNKSFDCYQKAAMQGHVQACIKVAQAYCTGKGVEKDLLKAGIWYQKAALVGDIKSQFFLADLYRRGDSLGIKQDFKMAFEWYLKAAENVLKQQKHHCEISETIGLLRVAECYERGEGVKQNHAKAFEWYEWLYQLGGAQFAVPKLGEFCEKGLGVKQDATQAFHWYELWALEKDYNAVDLARCYETGLGTKQDYVQAFVWYEKAAADGNKIAQERLEVLRKRDDVVSLVKKDHDQKEQAIWRMKLKKMEELIQKAEKGDVNDQFELAAHFEKGGDIPQDFKQAIFWYEKAANGGHAVAQQQLGAIYEKSLLGIRKDYAQAYFWYQKAADQGNDEACAGLKSLKEKGYSPPVSTETRAASGIADKSSTVDGSSRKDEVKGTKSSPTISFDIDYDQLTLNKELGRGGFGVVYQGTWRFNNVAIKQLLTKTLSTEALEEFNSESTIMAQLRSEYIVQFYGKCVSPTYCLVMQYMPKGSLFSLLRSSEPLDWSVRYRIVIDIASGLAFLHSSNIFHRDLKSLNVLLDEHYRAKLCDFGLSKVKKENQSTATLGGPVGTLPWMAPELFERRSTFTAKADIYSLAMTLWEIASRKVPFADASSTSLIPLWVAQGQREDMPADCPLKVSSLIQFCWQTDPAKRPTAAEVVTYLRSDQTEFKSASPSALRSVVPISSIQGNLDSTAGSAALGTNMQANLMSGPVG